MGEWCIQHHGESGLTEKVQKSPLSLKDCENQVIEFVQEWTPKGKCPLAGNSVGQDGKFLEKYMPDFMAHLHYRSVNVFYQIYSREILTSLPRFDLISLTSHENSNHDQENY